MGLDPEEDRPRRQHYYFAHQYLREKAQDHPRLLIDKLREDSATRYLRFHWVSCGLAAKSETDEFIPADGLGCFPIDIDTDWYGVLVQLPTPERMAEAYFVAIILPTFDTALDACEFFALEFSKNMDGSKRTVFGKWCDGSHLNMGDGPSPEREAFIDSICTLLLKRTHKL